MSSNQIERITIVGGGTAGWLTALILNTHLNRNTRNKACKITVIESPKVPTIGVGESTIQKIKSTLQVIGINETEFLYRTNGSFKLGVRFADWSRSGGLADQHFFHPLWDPPPCGGLSPAYHFRKFGPHWMGASFGESVLPNARVIAAGKGPRSLSWRSPS